MASLSLGAKAEIITAASRSHRLNLTVCHCLCSSPPFHFLPTTPLSWLSPQTCQPHSCLRTFAWSMLVAGMLFPQVSSWLPALSPPGRYSDVTFSMRTNLLFFPIYFCLWHWSPSGISCHTFYLFSVAAFLSPVWFLQENSCKRFLQENVSSSRAGIFVFVFAIWNGVQ